MVVADFATDLVTGLVENGLRRAVRSIASEIARRPKMRRALSSRAKQIPRPSPAYERALDELRRVIANEYGQYTEPVAAFFRELHKTALPDEITNHALTARAADALFPTFDKVYEACKPLPFSSRQLFDALNLVLTLRIEASVEDPALLDIIRAQHSDISRRLDEIVSSLRQAAQIDVLIGPADMADARVRLAKSIEASHKYLSVETSQGHRRVPIRDLVISARLRELSGTTISGPDFENSPDTAISLSEFRQTFQRAVILGDPGGGKSTLTQFVCFELARAIRLEAQQPGRREFQSRDLRIPVRIMLRSLEGRQKKQPGYNILDYIQDDVREQFANEAPFALALLTQLLALGSAVIIFDGLDEILDVDARRNMALAIERFSETYASCPVIVTSRFVGYRDAELSDVFRVFELARLNRDEISAFAKKLIHVITAKDAKDTPGPTAEAFVGQTEQVAADLRQNPLMLGLMVYLFCIRGDVPAHRPEIYKECALLMFEKWDKNRAIVFDRPTDFDLLDLFSFLASKIFGNPEREVGVSEDWLQNSMRSFFEEYYVEKPRAVRTARALVEFVTGRAWVMCDVGPRTYKFTHRTFLEYFFARDLISQSVGVPDLIEDRLLPRVKKAEWEVISHLALHTAVYRDGGKMRQAAEKLQCLLGGKSFAADEEIAFLDFVACSLEYLVVAEQRFVDLAERVFRRAVALGAHNDYSSHSIILRLVSKTSWRQELVKPVLQACLAGLLKTGARDDKLYCLYLIAKYGPMWPGRYSGTRSASSGKEACWYFEPCYAAHKHALLEVANEDVVFARAWSAAFPNDRLALYQRYGIDLLSPKIEVHEPTILTMSMVLLLADSMAVWGTPRGRQHGLLPSNTAAVKLLEVIAADAANGRLNMAQCANAEEVPQGLVDSIAVLGRHMFYSAMGDKPSSERVNMACNFFVVWLILHESLGLQPDDWRADENGRRRPVRGLFGELQRLLPQIKDAENYRLLSGWFDGRRFLNSAGPSAG